MQKSVYIYIERENNKIMFNYIGDFVKREKKIILF